jgi:hypothetical protein
LAQQSTLFGIDLVIVVVIVIERGFFIFDFLEQLVDTIKFLAFALSKLIFGKSLQGQQHSNC